jgi:phage terminase large subunit-like protein
MNEAGRKRVKRVIDFIQELTIPSGKGAGKRFKLRPFQIQFIEDVYGNVEDGVRITRRAVLSIARKNGKTALIAALALVHLVGPEAEQNGEIYSAANDREQASIIFKYARQLIELNEELQKHCEVIPSTKRITCGLFGSVYHAISREAGTKMGFNPSMVIYDELSQAKNRDLFDALDTSMGARDEPLLVIISTQSNDPEHILSQIIDDGLKVNDGTTVVHLYAVPDDCEDIFDEEVWAQANPALGDFRSLPDMRAMAERAKRMPSFESSFRNLYLNQRVDVRSPLISRNQWMACFNKEAKIPFGSEIYLALDLSSTTDLSSLTAITAEDDVDILMQWFWKPEELIREHVRRDQVPYDEWARAGWLSLIPGRTIDVEVIARTIGECCQDYRVKGLCYDRWRIDTLLKELDRLDIRCWVEGKDDTPENFEPEDGALRMVPWGQGFKDMAPAVDELEKSIIDRRLQHNNNPLLNFCFANAISIQDPAGNRKLDKSKVRFRIDGAVTTAMAIGLKVRDRVLPREEAEYQIMVV